MPNAKQLIPFTWAARNQDPMPVLASDFYVSRSGTGVDPQHRLHSSAIEGLDSLLDPSSVEQGLEQAGVATLHKRRLPLEMMLWCVISMAFFRHMSALGGGRSHEHHAVGATSVGGAQRGGTSLSEIGMRGRTTDLPSDAEKLAPSRGSPNLARFAFGEVSMTLPGERLTHRRIGRAMTRPVINNPGDRAHVKGLQYDRIF